VKSSLRTAAVAITADNTGTANAGECTQAQNNTSACDHTDYATQTSGHGI
jgi:hypothetical protein